MRVGGQHQVTIVGAGPSGLLLAVLLAQRGIASEVLEGGPDPREAPPPPYAPAILALGERGRHALRSAGLEDEVGQMVTAMRGRMIHDRHGHTTLQPYGALPYEKLYSIPRQGLVRCLLEAVEAGGKTRLSFERRLSHVDWSDRKLRFEDGAEQSFEVLVGADGPVSAVRRAMLDAGRIEVTQALLEVGWKALFIPPGPGGAPSLDRDALHVWPRGGYSMVAMPDPDGGFPAMLFLPLQGDHRMPWGFAELDTWTRQKAFMEFNFPDLASRVPDLQRAFRDNPVGRMGTVRCAPWQVDSARGGPALLVGDAAHCIVPFHGQGVNASFEDCTCLVEILDAGADTWDAAFRGLYESRHADTAAIADMALDAYGIMRDAVRHRDFMLRKALERELERRHPGLFVPRYSLVMFHRVPYAEAYRRGRVQAEILRELLEGKQALGEVDLEQAARMVTERLEPVEP